MKVLELTDQQYQAMIDLVELGLRKGGVNFKLIQDDIPKQVMDDSRVYYEKSGNIVTFGFYETDSVEVLCKKLLSLQEKSKYTT